MGRRAIDVVLVVTLLAAAFVVWIGGLGLASAGLALDHPLCLESQPDCASSWSWSPPGKRYEWVDLEGGARSATEPWASRGTDSWTLTVIVFTGALVGTAAVTARFGLLQRRSSDDGLRRRGRSSPHV